MTSGQLKDAVILMNAVKETFPDVAVDKQHMETDDDEEKEAETLDTLSCLKNVFMGKIKNLIHVCFVLFFGEGGRKKKKQTLN